MWGFQNTEPNVEADPDEDNADHEGRAPAPDQELVAGDCAECQHRQISEEQSGGYTELGPDAVLKPRRRLDRAHSIESSTEPPHLAADADALDKA